MVFTSAGVFLRALATSATSASVLGRNSWSGGSRSRMVTGSPAMTLKMALKSLFCMGSIFLRALILPLMSSERIISRTARIRSASKNMCSVRHSPIPSAPKFRATRESFGVSALVRTPSFLNSSAQPMTVPKAPESVGSTVLTWPSMISPFVPSREIQSPFLIFSPPMVQVCFR